MLRAAPEFSIASVSRVLNASSPVTDQLRESVHEAVRELDYRIDKRARSLRRQRSGTLALIVSEVGNPFFPGVLHAIERAADENGFCLYFCNADEDEPAASGPYRIDDGSADRGRDRPCRSARIPLPSHRCSKGEIPTVLLDRVVAEPVADAVLLDNEAAAELAVEHLYALGHRRIAFVTVAGNPPGDQRLRGAREAAAARGCEIGPLIDYVGDLKESGGYAQMLAILAAPLPPTAIIFGNNRMAIGGLAALQDNGLRLPENISAISFDDVSWARLTDPPLTTVSQPLNEIGRAAVELLLDRIEGRVTGPPRELSAGRNASRARVDGTRVASDRSILRASTRKRRTRSRPTVTGGSRSSASCATRRRSIGRLPAIATNSTFWGRTSGRIVVRTRFGTSPIARSTCAVSKRISSRSKISSKRLRRWRAASIR